MKNRRYHRGIKRSPFEAMFGKPMKLGYESEREPSDEQCEFNEGDDEEQVSEKFV